jgi:Na+/H+ antiporter NhaD/arsenite permease-like protein
MPGDAAGFAVLGAPFEFFLFGATLVGVAVFHRHTLNVALVGVGAIALYKLAFTGFDEGAGFAGLGGHLAGEWVILANLALLLTGFAILTRHFEQSKLPDLAPDVLPDDWTGGLTLLAMIFVVSGFLDNIAAALIGATVARHVYKNKVHIGFLAAIVAAANAGGAGSVVGDTTTTMMWISGKSPLNVAHGYIGALTAFAVFAIPAARMQQKYQPILKHDVGGIRPDWWRVGIVVFILVAAVVANVVTSIVAPQVPAAFPVIGAAVWGAVLLSGLVRKTDLRVLREAGKGTLFLLSLVLAASFMPVKALPEASWATTLSLGFISAVFDNIPLTALGIKQGGYDWGILAFAVGFGGSMIWFGSSAGVAASNLFPEAKSVTAWLRAAWWLPAAYVIGFFVSIGILGWHPPL